MNQALEHAARPPKSVITCDLEGRIETFNDGAEAIFGYRRDEVIGKKRVSVFSPGLVVLGHVGAWLEEAKEKGRFETRTVFLRRDGTPFAADIRITPTYRKGRHVGYCGVTVPRPDVEPEEAMPRVGPWMKLFAALVITRAPFLTATLVPVLAVSSLLLVELGAAAFPWGRFALALFGALALHVAANTFNDHFDWKSGADPENNDYFLPYSGGSRSVELGLISEEGLFRIGVVAIVLAASAGALLVWTSTPWVLAFGAAGAFAAYFYTAPPLRLVARKGLGELFVGLSFGPLLVGGTLVALEGALSAGVGQAMATLGVCFGLLTTAILWVNEFPDAPADERAGKRNLVVVLGRRAARWGYPVLLVGAALSLVAGVLVGVLPAGALLGLLPAPLGAFATSIVFRSYDDRSLIRACSITIWLQLAVGLAVVAGVLLVGAL